MKLNRATAGTLPVLTMKGGSSFLLIEARKRRRLFERVVAALPTRSVKAFMIGKQLDRDIAPAKAAGLTTIFFPRGFKSKWQPAEADIQPDLRSKISIKLLK